MSRVISKSAELSVFDGNVKEIYIRADDGVVISSTTCRIVGEYPVHDASGYGIAWISQTIVAEQKNGRHAMFYSMRSSDGSVHRTRRQFPEFQIVLQPIVDLETETVYAYEALCRGPRGENYAKVTEDFEPWQIPAFDKLAMAKSLRLAAAMRLEWRGSKLAINLGPLMELRGKDSHFVVRLAKHYGIRTDSLVLELSEGVRLDGDDLARIVDLHRKAGVVIAIDDFGAGYAGLSVLARCAPDVVKIDRELIKGIESDRAKKTIVEAFSKVCRKLRVKLIAEGVETVEEYLTLRGFGIRFMQGFLFARPVTCELPQVRYPRNEPRHFSRITRDELEWFRNAIRQ